MKKSFAMLLSAVLLAGSTLMTAQVSAEQTLQIKGSDTMVHLATQWAEAFMKANPDAKIAVTGGGSGTGIAALFNKTTDIACSSRDIKSSEIEKAKGMGIDIKGFVSARDGIAVIVNPENPVSDLTMTQIKKLYIGEAKKWKAVGGPNKSVILLSRDSSSGTFAFFQEEVLEKMDYSVEARRMPSTSAIVQAVTKDKWAIGYVGLGYVDSAGDKIKPLKVNGVAPSQETVLDNSYIINRPLHLYTGGEPTGLAKEFIDFALGEEGQKIVADQGFVPVK